MKARYHISARSEEQYDAYDGGDSKDGLSDGNGYRLPSLHILPPFIRK